MSKSTVHLIRHKPNVYVKGEKMSNEKKFPESVIEFEIKAICDKYIQQFNFRLVGKFRIIQKSFSKCCYSRLTSG